MSTLVTAVPRPRTQPTDSAAHSRRQARVQRRRRQSHRRGALASSALRVQNTQVLDLRVFKRERTAARAVRKLSTTRCASPRPITSRAARLNQARCSNRRLAGRCHRRSKCGSDAASDAGSYAE